MQARMVKPCWTEPTPQIPLRIIVEGLIGAGKTELSRQLSTYLTYALLEEPVETNPFLQLFYNDPKRWGFSMQVNMLTIRLAMEKAGTYMVNAGLVPGIVSDRSLGGDTVFLEVNHQLGNICEQERQLYLNLFETMKITCPYPDVLLFLDVPLDVLRQRIQARGRSFEQPLCDPGNHYLELLSGAYDRFCGALKRHTVVMVLDWTTFKPIEQVWQQILSEWDQQQKSRFNKVLMRW